MLKEVPDVLTPEQTAKILNISKNSVYRLIREHLLGCKRIGRKIIIPKVCLIAYLRSALHTVKV